MRTLAAVIGVAAAASAGLSSCSLLGPSVYDLEVGNCFSWASSEDAAASQVDSKAIEIVECSEPHDAEAFVVTELADREWDAAAIQTALFERCATEFTTYVGSDYVTSEVYLDGLVPTETSWNDGERRALCYVFVPEERVTGSLKGSAR